MIQQEIIYQTEKWKQLSKQFVRNSLTANSDGRSSGVMVEKLQMPWRSGTDATGAAVPNAALKLEETSRGVSRTAVSNADGRFSFDFVAIGNYKLTVANLRLWHIEDRRRELAGQRAAAALKRWSSHATEPHNGARCLIETLDKIR
jgi:hypothetical protein